MMIILQKIIAASGLASRREAEKLIKTGRVKINGRTAEVGEQASANDQITVNDRPLPDAAPKIYIKLNKPISYTCTNRSFPGEKNIFELVDVPTQLFAVGRLDKNSRGLILLTNDGDLAQRLSHPKFQEIKTYEVRIREKIINPTLIIEKFLTGLDIGEGDGVVKANTIRYLQNQTFVITLSAGKKRQIRRMFGVCGLAVIDLQRTAISGLQLEDLPIGRWAYLNEEEIKQLKYE